MNNVHTKKSTSFLIALMMGILCLGLVLSRSAQSDNYQTNEWREISRDMIRLSDIFQDISPSKDQNLTPAPAPGSSVTIDMKTIIKLAQIHGISWTPTSTMDHITIKRAGIIISEQDQETAILNAITPQIQGKFNLVLSTSLTPISLPVSSSTVLTVGDIKLDPRTDVFQTTIAPVSQPQKIQPISGRIERIMDVPTVKSTLTRGTVISTNDLSSIEMKSTDIRGDIVINPDQIVGRSARQNLNPGRLIRISDTEIPVSVKRGQKINLVYKTGQLELTALGRAMEDGRVGDHIRVTNGSSNKPLQGTVLANNQVEMDE